MLCSNKTQNRTLHTSEWEQTTIRNLHQYSCKTTCLFYLVWKLRNFAFNSESKSSVEFHPIASSLPALSLWNICHTCECNMKKSWSLKSEDARGNKMIEVFRFLWVFDKWKLGYCRYCPLKVIDFFFAELSNTMCVYM